MNKPREKLLLKLSENFIKKTIGFFMRDKFFNYCSISFNIITKL